MTEHTHSHAPDAPELNGATQSSDEPQIYLPPVNDLINEYKSEVSRLTIENFELRSAATFQARMLQQVSAQLAEKLGEESKEKSEAPEEAPKAKGKTETKAG